MAMALTFIDFLNYISRDDLPEDFDADAYVTFFQDFIQPFAEEHGIEIPDKLANIIDALYEEDEDGDEEDEEDEEEDDGDEDEEEDGEEQ